MHCQSERNVVPICSNFAIHTKNVRIGEYQYVFSTCELSTKLGTLPSKIGMDLIFSKQTFHSVQRNAPDAKCPARYGLIENLLAVLGFVEYNLRNGCGY